MDCRTQADPEYGPTLPLSTLDITSGIMDYNPSSTDADPTKLHCSHCYHPLRAVKNQIVTRAPQRHLQILFITRLRPLNGVLQGIVLLLPAQ